MASIQSLVDFYRENSAIIKFNDSNSSMSLSCKKNSRNIELLCLINQQLGDKLALEIDYDDIFPVPFIEDNKEVNVKIDFINNNFYLNIESFIKKWKEISKGVLPPELFIVEDDYYSKDHKQTPERYIKLLNLTKIINSISYLSDYHDNKKNIGNSHYIFLNKENSFNTKPIIISTKVTKEILDLTPLDISILEQFNDSTEQKPIIVREKSIFTTTLVEFVSQDNDLLPDDYFFRLIKHWDSFIEAYESNLKIYISEFTFHKARKEVAENKIKISEQYAKILNDISNKLFGIPVSFAAVIIASKMESPLEITLSVLSLLVVSLLMHFFVSNQRNHLERINASKEMIFENLASHQKSYPEELQKKLKQAEDSFKLDYYYLKRRLCFIRVLSWLPFFILSGILLFKYLPPNYEILPTVKDKSSVEKIVTIPQLARSLHDLIVTPTQ